MTTIFSGIGNVVCMFKGRSINFEADVSLHRNLNATDARKRFSIKQNGLVVGHTSQVMLTDCRFVVSKAGQARVRREKRKNVHAFIKGRIALKGAMGISASGSYKFPTAITYNPYLNDTFVYKNMTEDFVPVQGAMAVCINQHGVTAAYIQQL